MGEVNRVLELSADLKGFMFFLNCSEILKYWIRERLGYGEKGGVEESLLRIRP